MMIQNVDVWAFAQKNIFVVAVFLVSGAMLLYPLVSRLFANAKEVSAQDAVTLINRRDAVVIDVSDAGEYKTGRLPNAVHIPMKDLKARLKELEKHKGKPLIVSCKTGGRSLGAAGIVRDGGFAEVVALRGGVAGWAQANLPVERDKDKG